MCRKLILSISFVSLLVNSVFAAQWTNADPANSLWSTPGNWQGGSIPISGVTAYLKGSLEGPTIQDGIDAVTGRLRGPAYDPGDLMTMTMTGGTLTCSSTWEIAEEGGTGVVNMYGGSVSSTVTNDDCLHLGGYGHATFNMYGGTLTMTGDMHQPVDTPGTGILKLYDGTFQVSDIHLSTNADKFGGRGLINIHRGTLVLLGNDTADVEAWLAAGEICGYDGKGTILYSYDSQADLTIVTAEEGPRYAYRPSPGDSAENVQRDIILRWWPGWEAADPNAHDVYFGTDFNDVNDANTTITLGVYKGSQSHDANSYEPGLLEFSRTYYWRIDEVNDANGDRWKGEVWYFTVANFIIVDDFESYDYDSNPIAYDWLTELGTWIEGMTNLTSSLLELVSAPNDLPTRGTGTMSFYYDCYNIWYINPFYAEAKLPIAEEDKDWTAGGLKALSLWFHGSAGNDTEQMYVALEDDIPGPNHIAVVEYDGDANDLKQEEWQEWNIELQHFAANDVNLASVDSFYIGFGDRDNPQRGGEGLVYFDDIRLYIPRCVAEYGPEADLSGDCLVYLEDLQVIVEEWLLPVLSADVAPYGGDGVVNFLDWAIFADGWQITNDIDDLAVFTDQWLGQALAAADVASDNGDGFVDFSDWAVFAAAWQSKPASPNWNPKCDIAPESGDDIVDMDDIFIFMEEWLRAGSYYRYLDADMAPHGGDGIVNMLDFAALADNWLDEKWFPEGP